MLMQTLTALDDSGEHGSIVKANGSDWETKDEPYIQKKIATIFPYPRR